MTLLEELCQTMATRYGILSRELTKLHEEFIRGSLVEIMEKLRQREVVKGEFTLLIEGAEEKKSMDAVSLEDEIRISLETSNEKPSIISKRLAEKTGISRKIIYEKMLEIKNR